MIVCHGDGEGTRVSELDFSFERCKDGHVIVAANREVSIGERTYSEWTTRSATVLVLTIPRLRTSAQDNPVLSM